MKPNYKEKVDRFLLDYTIAVQEIYDDGDIDYKTFRSKNTALEITGDFFAMSFDRAYKQYNQDEEKAYDLFNFKKYLEMFEVYVVSMPRCYTLFPDKYSDLDKKELRTVLNHLQSLNISDYLQEDYQS